MIFYINKKEIFLEKVLVDYMDMPIFFLCTDSTQQYYIALCTDIDESNYVISEISIDDVYDLLHGNIPMRNVLLNQKTYWEVVSGDDIYSDTVTQRNIEELDISLLPEAGACFEVLTPDLQNFVQEFDNSILYYKRINL